MLTYLSLVRSNTRLSELDSSNPYQQLIYSSSLEGFDYESRSRNTGLKASSSHPHSSGGPSELINQLSALQEPRTPFASYFSLIYLRRRIFREVLFDCTARSASTSSVFPFSSLAASTTPSQVIVRLQLLRDVIGVCCC